jgi:hypothetical protein
MYRGIIGSPWVAYDVPAAWNEAIEPASLIPSSRTWPSRDSRYESTRSASTGSYRWPWAA